MVGLIENIENVTTSFFKNEGDLIALIGDTSSHDGIGGSEYLKLIHNIVAGDAPGINLESEKNLVTSLLELTGSRLLNSAHDISDGGLAVALAEGCLINRTLMRGCSVNITYTGRKDFALFNESQSRVLVSFNSAEAEKIKNITKKYRLDYLELGTVGGDSIKIGNEINIKLEIASDAYYNSIKRIMED
jgi:phosphoribosylformylglycinamidine synthase